MVLGPVLLLQRSWKVNGEQYQCKLEVEEDEDEEGDLEAEEEATYEDEEEEVAEDENLISLYSVFILSRFFTGCVEAIASRSSLLTKHCSSRLCNSKWAFLAACSRSHRLKGGSR